MLIICLWFYTRMYIRVECTINQTNLQCLYSARYTLLSIGIALEPAWPLIISSICHEVVLQRIDGKDNTYKTCEHFWKITNFFYWELPAAIDLYWVFDVCSATTVCVQLALTFPAGGHHIAAGQPAPVCSTATTNPARLLPGITLCTYHTTICCLRGISLTPWVTVSLYHGHYWPIS